MKPTTPALASLVAGLFVACGGVQVITGLEVSDVTCPSSCENLFGKLEKGVQEVTLQLRGEPKSGTTTSATWVSAGLSRVCTYLKHLYGQRSCRTQTSGGGGGIVFEPKADETAPCLCDGVKRVEIEFRQSSKHELPVDETCTFSHRNGLATAEDSVCQRRDSLPVEDGADLWRCVEEAECAFNDDSLQLAMMRDPRAATVSAYFHRIRVNPERHFELESSVDTYFQEMLRVVCRWTAVRYLLFTELLADQSELFLLEDLEIDPADWYGRVFSFVGLHLPFEFIHDTAQHASGRDGTLGYGHIDEHPGGHASGVTSRTFKDELGPESLAMMDDVVRLWLPPVLVQRFGIEP